MLAYELSPNTGGGIRGPMLDDLLIPPAVEKLLVRTTGTSTVGQ